MSIQDELYRSALPFSKIFNKAMDESSMSYAELSDILRSEYHTVVDRKRLSEYAREISTPPFENAMAIIRALGIEFTDEQLLASLKKNKDTIKEQKERSLNNSNEGFFNLSVRHTVKKNITVNYKGLIDGKTEEEIERVLKARTQDLFKKENDDARLMSLYVRYLIKKDLQSMEG